MRNVKFDGMHTHRHSKCMAEGKDAWKDFRFYIYTFYKAYNIINRPGTIILKQSTLLVQDESHNFDTNPMGVESFGHRWLPVN